MNLTKMYDFYLNAMIHNQHSIVSNKKNEIVSNKKNISIFKNLPYELLIEIFQYVIVSPFKDYVKRIVLFNSYYLEYSPYNIYITNLFIEKKTLVTTTHETPATKFKKSVIVSRKIHLYSVSNNSLIYSQNPMYIYDLFVPYNERVKKKMNIIEELYCNKVTRLREICKMNKIRGYTRFTKSQCIHYLMKL